MFDNDDISLFPKAQPAYCVSLCLVFYKLRQEVGSCISCIRNEH